MIDVAKARAAFLAYHNATFNGGPRPTMCVPPQPDDHDMILSRFFDDAEALAATSASQRAEIARLTAALDEARAGEAALREAFAIAAHLAESGHAPTLSDCAKLDAALSGSTGKAWAERAERVVEAVREPWHATEREWCRACGALHGECGSDCALAAYDREARHD